jgi:anthranilate phosphoribosyltransferase
LEENRRILEAVLQGGGTAAQRQVVALNTALVLWAGGHAGSVAEGLEQSLAVQSSDAAWQRLLALRAALAPAG